MSTVSSRPCYPAAEAQAHARIAGRQRRRRRQAVGWGVSPGAAPLEAQVAGIHRAAKQEEHDGCKYGSSGGQQMWVVNLLQFTPGAPATHPQSGAAGPGKLAGREACWRRGARLATTARVLLSCIACMVCGCGSGRTMCGSKAMGVEGGGRWPPIFCCPGARPFQKSAAVRTPAPFGACSGSDRHSPRLR